MFYAPKSADVLRTEQEPVRVFATGHFRFARSRVRSPVLYRQATLAAKLLVAQRVNLNEERVIVQEVASQFSFVLFPFLKRRARPVVASDILGPIYLLIRQSAFVLRNLIWRRFPQDPSR